MTVKKINNFNEFSQMKNSGELSVVDFYADWCGPCKMISPRFKEMSEETKYANVNFYQVDVDGLPDVAASEEIEAMPTFIFYKNGNKLEMIVGANVGLLSSTLKRLAA